jgi:hypothetical protein
MHGKRPFSDSRHLSCTEVVTRSSIQDVVSSWWLFVRSILAGPRSRPVDPVTTHSVLSTRVAKDSPARPLRDSQLILPHRRFDAGGP